MLIVLPPSLHGADCGRILHSLLSLLFAKGLLMEDMQPTKKHAETLHHASWVSFVYACGVGGKGVRGCYTP
jgi:hypothetical protein